MGDPSNPDVSLERTWSVATSFSRLKRNFRSRFTYATGGGSEPFGGHLATGWSLGANRRASTSAFAPPVAAGAMKMPILF